MTAGSFGSWWFLQIAATQNGVCHGWADSISHSPIRSLPVGPKYSCGSLIEFEQSTEPLVALAATSVGWWGNSGREEELIAFALVRAFEMIMLND